MGQQGPRTSSTAEIAAADDPEAVPAQKTQEYEETFNNLYRPRPAGSWTT